MGPRQSKTVTKALIKAPSKPRSDSQIQLQLPSGDVHA